MDDIRLNNLKVIKKCGLNILDNLQEMESLKIPLDNVKFEELGEVEKSLTIDIIKIERKIQAILKGAL